MSRRSTQHLVQPLLHSHTIADHPLPLADEGIRRLHRIRQIFPADIPRQIESPLAPHHFRPHALRHIPDLPLRPGERLAQLYPRLPALRQLLPQCLLIRVRHGGKQHVELFAHRFNSHSSLDRHLG